MIQKNRTIDKTIPIPMFYQLKQILLEDIKSGTYTKGDMIPTEAELSVMFDVSRATVRQAVLELVQEGYLTRTKGKGTFVAQNKLMHTFIQRIESFEDEMSRLGYISQTEVLELCCIDPTPEIAKILGIPCSEKCIYLYRKRSVENEPLVTIKTYLPYNRCKHLLNYDLQQHSLYKVLSQDVATTIHKIDRTIEVSLSNTSDAKHLNIPKKEPIKNPNTVSQTDTPI